MAKVQKFAPSHAQELQLGVNRALANSEAGWLPWLAKVRIIIITFLFGIQLTISNLTPSNVPRSLFIAIIALSYTIALFMAVVVTLWSERRFQARLQVLTDLLLATALVYITGGIDSSFNFLYPLIIIVGSILLPRSWAYLTAALAFILDGAMLELTYFGVIKSYSLARPDLRSLQVSILVNLVAFLAIADLSSRLVKKLRQVGDQLENTSGALENLQALHENIINSMTGGLITTDTEDLVTFVNASAQRLLDRPAAEIIGQPVDRLFLDRLPQPNSTSAENFEVRAHCPNSRQRQKTFGVRSSLLTGRDHDGIGFMYSFDDLTEIRRLEREIRLRDRLSAVGRMAAGIAHEIRNPLSSIAGSVKVLSSVAVLNDEQKTLVDIVTRESERLNQIISDFLTYTREKQYEFKTVDLISLLDDALSLLTNRLPSFGSPLADKPSSCPVIVRDFEAKEALTIADADRLKQVFWNISENAIRAMPDGGVLTVKVHCADGNWIVNFKDNGHGMKGTEIEKMFEPFQSDFVGGTGLGLAIVYQIVQAHDAKISVKSAPGEGAEFILQFKRSGSATETMMPNVSQFALSARPARMGTHG